MTLPTDAWQVFHRYNKLVARGYVKAFSCARCAGDLILRIDTRNDDPAQQCAACNIMIYPGLAEYNVANAVVREHTLYREKKNNFSPPV